MTKQQTSKFTLVLQYQGQKFSSLIVKCFFHVSYENTVAHHLNGDHIVLFSWSRLHDSVFDIT